MASVTVNFDNKLHANAFAIWLESEGMEAYKESTQYEAALENKAAEIDDYEVKYDERSTTDVWINHKVETYEIEDEEQEDTNEDDE